MLRSHSDDVTKYAQEAGEKDTWVEKAGREKGDQIRYGGKQERSPEGQENEQKYGSV